MAFAATPNAWLENWSEDGTEITVPIATFPELTAGEADATTGDIRKIVYALMEKLYNEFNERAAADRPVKMTINKSSSYNQATGRLTVSYGVNLELALSGAEVAAES